ncbi:hypothetical protein DACRYDRAFT_116350 [Dacryopinax primogenitus]|uniref:rRNA-processing protein n=1 Tax=Dacryopinax primogenitus (strain DJM 731) TaxID=1858805 RepID=M5FVS0_DACPD|nr:uncharacterized protein DACRYDRAFT_116350 [Dacryopinax primogenitus]EJU01936.1 hypothetical protein DACRYDRAFT_116350 [Dacryopinax primogenitus]
MEAEASTSAIVPQDTDTAIPLRASAGGRESGKLWKSTRAATRRTQMPKSLKSKSWEARVAERTQEEATRKIAKEMRDEKQAEADRKREVLRERRKVKEEKARLEAMAAKLSAKKLARMKKRAGRSKTVQQ